MSPDIGGMYLRLDRVGADTPELAQSVRAAHARWRRQRRREALRARFWNVGLTEGKTDTTPGGRHGDD